MIFKTASWLGTEAPELVSGTRGGGACRKGSSGLGRAAGSLENEPIHSLPEGHNLGSSWCGREEPVSSTLALPFNPSQHGPQGQTVRARSGRSASSGSLEAGLRTFPGTLQVRDPLGVKKKKIAGLFPKVLRASRTVQHSPPRSSLAPLGTNRGSRRGVGWVVT